MGIAERIIKLIYILILVVGTTYLVGWCGWSKWTYVLMFILGYTNIEMKIKRSVK